MVSADRFRSAGRTAVREALLGNRRLADAVEAARLTASQSLRMNLDRYVREVLVLPQLFAVRQG